MLVGDMNVDSTPDSNFTESMVQYLNPSDNYMSDKDNEVIERYRNEYQSLLEIYSNDNMEKITDCLQVSIDANLADQENESPDKKLICVTYADSTVDAEGTTIPSELALTDPTEFLMK